MLPCHLKLEILVIVDANVKKAIRAFSQLSSSNCESIWIQANQTQGTCPHRCRRESLALPGQDAKLGLPKVGSSTSQLDFLPYQLLWKQPLEDAIEATRCSHGILPSTSNETWL